MPGFHENLADLPVAGAIDEIVAASCGGPVVVTAPPGSGKTMLVPAAIHDDLRAHGTPNGRLVLLQPRRLPARAVALQIARLRGGSVGGEVGYQVRFDSRVGRDTSLFVETTGIMLRRLLSDTTIDGIDAVVLDEFHERSIEMDLVLGMLVRLRDTIRPDLRLVVMSATLDAKPVASLLGGARVIEVDGQPFPVTVRHQRHGQGVVQRQLPERIAELVPEALASTPGHLLVFLPGVGEIAQTSRLVEESLVRQGHDLLPLYGDLPPEDQDRVLVESGRRKVILATNVAETSITIPGVTGVIDAGLARQQVVCAATGLPRLELVPISRASAAQRAGRAGRTAPGICWRLWDEAAHASRPEHHLPEVLRGDLTGPLLQLAALGEGDDFPWLDQPPPEARATARSTLAHLGGLDAAGKITPLGAELAALPAHPRLARLLLVAADTGVLREASIAAAVLSERDPFRATAASGRGPRDRHTNRTRSDLMDRVVALQQFHAAGGRPVGDASGLEPHPAAARSVLRTAEQLYRFVDRPLAARAADPAAALRAALLTAFPDRLARGRPGSSDRGTMVGGRGVRLDGGSRVRQEPFFLALDINDAGGEAVVRLASAIDGDWLEAASAETGAPITLREELLFHPGRKQVEARRQRLWIDLVIEETPIAIVDPQATATLLADAAGQELSAVLPAEDSAAGRFRSRVRWLATTASELGLPDLGAEGLKRLLPGLCHGLRSFAELRAGDWLGHLQAAVGFERLPDIDRLAPETIQLASGKDYRLRYEPGKPPVLAIRIQELFGTPDTPRVAGGRIPVLLELLGPNHRPQQVTSDLASFWANTYPQVRKDLRGRYPKHPWPEDPLAAPPGGRRRG